MNVLRIAAVILCACACACASASQSTTTTMTTTTTSTATTSSNVLFAGGAFLQDTPSLTESEYATHTAKPARHVDICQGPRDAVDACARLENGCRPLALPGAWSPCYGSGALCTHTYREQKLALIRANPPTCVCSCSEEFAAAIARDEALMRDPPP